MDASTCMGCVTRLLFPNHLPCLRSFFPLDGQLYSIFLGLGCRCRRKPRANFHEVAQGSLCLLLMHDGRTMGTLCLLIRGQYGGALGIQSCDLSYVANRGDGFASLRRHSWAAWSNWV